MGLSAAWARKLGVAMPRRRALRIVDTSARREASSVTVRMPIPPSTNRIWRPVTGGIIDTAEYIAWKVSADKEIMAQRPASVRGPYALYIEICREETRADIDNLAKPISDALQRMRIIDNDRHAEHIELDWGSEPGIVARVISTAERAA